MIRASKLSLLLAGASLLTVTACMDTRYLGEDDPNKNTREGAILGGLVGAVSGAIIADDNKKGAIIGGIAGAALGGAIGQRLDAQEAELRESLDNRVTITNTGDRLIVTMPQDILFATDSASLRSDLQADIRTVGRSLLDYPNTTVQVLGHTDSDGDASYNLGLSQRRAQSVASLLIAEGVPSSRVRAIGRGEDQPVASNLTAEGKQQNRRVEIVILPTG